MPARLAARWFPLVILPFGLAMLGLGPIACAPDREAPSTAERSERTDSAGRSAAAPDGGPPSSEQQALDRSATLVAAGEAAHALWEAEAGLRAFPTSDALRLRVAELALLVGNPTLSQAMLLEIEADSPQRAGALIALARAQQALGRVPSAVESLEQAQAEFPLRGDIRLLRVALLVGADRKDEAIAVVEQAMRDASSSQGELDERPFEVVLARLLAAEGDADTAIESLLALAGESQGLVPLWAALSQLMWREGRADEAVERITATILENPDVAEALRPLLARLQMSLGRYELAEETLREMIGASGAVAAYIGLAELSAARGEPDRTMEILSEAIDRHPRDRMLRAMHVESLIALDRLEEAKAEYAIAARQQPDDALVEFLRARIDLAEGRPREAAERLRTLMPRFDRAETHFWLARALEESGDFRGAERRYALAVPRRTGWPAPRYALALLAQRRRDWAAVVRHAGALARDAPAKLEGWVLLSEGLAELGAKARLERVQQVLRSRFADQRGAQIAVARSQRRAGDIAGALETLADTNERLGPSVALEAERVLTLGIAGRVSEGLELARAALEVTPDSPRLFWARASLYYAAGEAEAGDADVDRSLGLDPGDLAPLRLRCRYRASIREFERAAADCARYVAERPDDPEAQFVLAVAEEARGRSDVAAIAYRRAAKLDPKSSDALNNLAWLLADQGDLDGALDAAQRAYSRSDDDLNTIDTLAQVYLRVGLVARAIGLLKRAQMIDPSNATVAQRLEEARRTAPARPEKARSAARLKEAPTPGDFAPPMPALHLPGANVLLIVVDTLRADATSAYDPSLDTTPELERWARHGVLFEAARSQSSWTKISVASLMTSLWPSSHGIHETDDGLSPEALTLAEVLKSHGYATYGVQTNGWLHHSFGFQQGFDRYLFPRGGTHRQFPRASVWPHAERVFDEAVRTLRAHDATRPFFLYLHFMDVHEYASPPGFRRYGTDSRGAYAAAVRWIDSIAARLREHLEAVHLLDSTLIVFASDHGETFGEHGVYGHARNVLTPVLSVPLVFRVPGLETPVRVPTQVRLLDVAPTILAALDIPVPDRFEGRALQPLIGSITDRTAADRTNFAGLGKRLFRDASVQRVVSDGSWTYARNIGVDGAPAEFLFDRSVDPGENVNLISLESSRAARMSAELTENLRQVADGVRQPGVTIDPGIAQRLRALGYLDGAADN